MVCSSRHRLSLQLSAFEADESVGQCVLLFGRDVLADYFQQVGKGHYGTAHHEVEQLFLLFGACMAGGYVFQSDAAGYLGGYAHFLADAVHQVKLHFGKEYRQWDARKAAPRA